MENELFGVQRIAAEIGAPYAVLRRYAEMKDVATMMSGQRVEGALGNRFPASSLPLWKDLARLHKMRAITPMTAAQALPIIWSITGIRGTTEASEREHSRHEVARTGFEEICGLRVAAALERLADAAERVLPPPQAPPTKMRWRRTAKR